MRRMLMVLMAAALLVAMVAFTAAPAFAQGCSSFGLNDVSQAAQAPGPYGSDHVSNLPHPGAGKLISSEVGPNGSGCSFS